jgi:hypothetical protein
MRRTNVVIAVGACVAAPGTFLALRAGSLATRVGVALLAAAWQWMAAGREASRRPPVHV